MPISIVLSANISRAFWNELPVIVDVRQLIAATVARLLGCMHRFVQKEVHGHPSLIVCTLAQLKIRNKSSNLCSKTVNIKL